MLAQVANACRVFRDRPAFMIDGKYFSYAEFAQSLSAVRVALSLHCGGHRGNIGILALDDLETYAAVFGTMFSGRTFVPINPSLPPDRNASIITQAGINTILSSSKDIDIPDSEELTVIYTRSLPTVEVDLSLPEIRPIDIAYILFTSGSTGVPKGVPISHRNLSSFVDAFFECTCELNERDRVLQMFELTFDFSIASYMTPLAKGACVCTVPREVIKYTHVYDLLENHDITIAPMVPSILSYLRPYFEEIHLPKLRHSYFCGEALYSDVAKEWSKCVPNALIQNFYGPTEVTVFSLVYNCSDDWSEDKAPNGIVSIGKPMSNIAVILVDENLEPVLDGQRGELCLAGPQVTPGYWENAEKNAESFFDCSSKNGSMRYYRTGDLAFRDEDGDFHFCGRVDFQVQVQGYRVELSEIEYHARQAAPKRNLCAVAFQNRIGNTQIHLFVEGVEERLERIADHIRSKLPSYMVPSVVTFVPALPLNQNGKMDRITLAQWAKEEDGA